jgi:hypothetical protein
MRRATVLWLSCILVTGLSVTSAWAGGIVNGVPDWHQPCLIGGGNGPDNGGNPGAGQACYKAWCVPTAVSDIMGFWRDVKGCMAVADGQAYVSGSLIPWTPPTPTDWQDDAADASSIPTVGGSFRANGADLGWYLNTNDQGDQSLPNAGGGETFSGTKTADIQQGISNYLNAAGYMTATVNESICDAATGWATITSEIDAGRPLIGLFTHGSITQSTPGSNEWYWSSYSDPNDPQTGEEWGDGANKGHAMTIVGYLNGGDAGTPDPNVDCIIVQDNRRHTIDGAAEADNNFYQHILPFYNTAAQMGVAPWKGYVTIDIPEPATMLLLSMGAVVALRRRRR